MSIFAEDSPAGVVPLWLVREQDADHWFARVGEPHARRIGVWAKSQGFVGERGRLLLVPGVEGELLGVALGLGKLASLDQISYGHLAGLNERLPAGCYRIDSSLTPEVATRAALGFGLGAYRFDRYRRAATVAAGTGTLVPPKGADMGTVRQLVEADRLARDLINTPACDLGPVELATAVRRVGERFGAEIREVVGEALLTDRFPAIHAVGRAASALPRLVELRHGAVGPRVTLVGKGVCFDTGGLDLKPASAMGLMKKDMGGAACALALAQLLMQSGLAIQLRLLIPAVENSVAGNAYRPGDVLTTRAGLTVEITNTDAEGRLVLADALTYAAEDSPDLIVDFATLTGAARVALGPELPALFASGDALAERVALAARQVGDPVWPMPLWAGYDDDLASKVADLANASSQPFAGAIVAALFLRRFVPESIDWVHLDLYGWNGRERPGRPVGAEAHTVRALHAYLLQRYGGAG
jgi:leucyl aminopeptidase